MQKSSILEVQLCSRYTLSIEIFLDRLGQSNKLWNRSKKKFRDIEQKTPNCPQDLLWKSSSGSPENVLGTSQINVSGTSPRRQIRTFSGRYFGTSLVCQIGTSPGWSHRIFVGRSWDFGVERPRDVLWTNIYQLGLSYLKLIKLLLEQNFLHQLLQMMLLYLQKH